MPSFMLSNFASMRGFGMPGVPNGFCGGIAILGANRHRPSVNNAGYSLSPYGAAKLYATMRTHTYHDPGQGIRLLCDPNGAQNIYGTHAGLSAIASGTPTLVDYAHFNWDTFHQACKDILTRKTALIVEWANGAALGSDEPTLHYHFTTIGGIDSTRSVDEMVGGYATCDDDSSLNAWPARANPPIWHSIETLQLARPIAYIVCAA